MKRATRLLLISLAIATGASPSAQAKETTEFASVGDNARLARDHQSPSPAGAGKARAQIVDADDFSLAVRGFGRFVAVPYLGRDALLENGDVANFPGFRMRRLTLGLEGQATSKLSFDVWMDLVSRPRLAQARLAWTFLPSLTLEAGVVKVPFSKSAVQSSAELLFSERPLSVDRLLPDRQPGVALYGALFNGLATYRAGVFNGAASDRAGLGNDHPGALVAGRIAVSPLGALRPGQSDLKRSTPKFELGASAMYDKAAGFDGLALGADASFQGYGASVLVEYVQQTRTPLSQPVVAPSISDRVKRTGFIAQASYLVWEKGLEVAVRGERVDDNDALDDVGDVDALAVGLHWNVMELDLRIDLDWYHRRERFGRPLDNDAIVLSTQGRF